MGAIGVINYGASNIYNICNALKYVGAKIKLITRPEEMKDVEKIIFPGVGSFREAAAKLKKMRLIEQIRKEINSGKAFLGICLGFQLLFNGSDEAKNMKGLSIFTGNLKKFTGIKVPHMGWNNVSWKEEPKLMNNIENNSRFYFVHSYYKPLENRDGIKIATTDYSCKFISAIEKGRCYGVQFHPERSGNIGIRVLENFAQIG